MGTKEDILPIGTMSREPDVEDDAVLSRMKKDVRVDDNGRLNVHDVTVWLFLWMTQPQVREGTSRWFWYVSCLLFSERGRYLEALQASNIGSHSNDGCLYSPERFVHAGHWTVNDVARHFHKCGLREKDANTIFFDFATRWIGRLEEPLNEPTWNKVPAPREIEFRYKIAQRARQSKRRTREEEPVQSSSGRWGTAVPPVQYDEPPPSGDGPPQEANAIQPPQSEESRQETTNPMQVDPAPSPPGEDPKDLSDDPSRM
jgi:hypothetical protein